MKSKTQKTKYPMSNWRRASKNWIEPSTQEYKSYIIQAEKQCEICGSWWKILVDDKYICNVCYRQKIIGDRVSKTKDKQ